MTQRELKEKLYDIVAEYWCLLDEKDSIVWGKTKPVNPNSPMISLGLAQVERPYRPARRYIDGVVHDSYPSTTILRVDLFTTGAPTTDRPNITARSENTAVNDLSDFANFLNSVYVDHWCGNNGVSLRGRTVQDLTALNNDTSWQYRALLEIDVGFMQNAAGHSGIGYENGVCIDGERPFSPNPSGGGSQALADDFTGYFTEVEGPVDTGRRGDTSPETKSIDKEYKKEAPRYG